MIMRRAVMPRFYWMERRATPQRGIRRQI